MHRVLVAGGAGCLGSHLCERVLERGDAVVCADTFLTGSIDNVARLIGNARFELIEHDVKRPLQVKGRLGLQPNTDDIRESPALALIRELCKSGAIVRAHDPKRTRLRGPSFRSSVLR